MRQATWPQSNFYSNYKGLFLIKVYLSLPFPAKEALARPILHNKIGSKKDAWLPRTSEWPELTSARCLSPSFPPKQTVCVYGSVDITQALYLCWHKIASCAAYMQQAEDSQDPQRRYCLVILHLLPHVADWWWYFCQFCHLYIRC